MKARWLIAMAVVALLLGGIGTAGAAKLFTGKDIRNRSLHGSDIARGSISKSNLSKGLQDQITTGSRQQTAASQSPGAQGQAGARGEKGDKGDKGDHGDKGDKGDKGDPGDPAFATLVTPFQNFKHTDPSAPQAQWGDDLFDCGGGTPTGTQGFVNGVSQDFSGQDTPAGSGAWVFKNSGNVDTAFVLPNGAFEGTRLADLSEFR